jgi:hypothetical protein
MLDEVDAPLDDSNTVRFCEMVKRMSVQTQFVFISHNKIAMEMAQQLIGVTMQEQGVSRVVEVDIEEALRGSANRCTGSASTNRRWRGNRSTRTPTALTGISGSGCSWLTARVRCVTQTCRSFMSRCRIWRPN